MFKAQQSAPPLILGNKFWDEKHRAVAPGDWAGAEEWVSNSAVSGITPRDKMRWCVKQEGAEFQRERAQAGRLLSASVSGAMTSAINSPAKVGRVGGEERFWLLYAWQPLLLQDGVLKTKQSINNSGDMHICMDEDEV